MRHAIITACDKKYGNFLINHWLKSLKSNVDLEDIDVIILDYGLSKKQISKLSEEEVTVIKCKKNGHVACIRFRDMAKFIEDKEYDQVMSVDAGDVIFQSDLKDLFFKEKNHMRCVIEDYNHSWASNIVDYYTNNLFFNKIEAKNIRNLLKKKDTVNAGLIIGPRKKFYNLCSESFNMLKTKSSYGPDQVAVSYVLYRDGFKKLDKKYNYVILSNKKREFSIKNGKFYFRDGEIIPIVHNAGASDILRSIKKFGYGRDRNKLKKITYDVIKSSNTIFKKISKNK